MSKSLRTVLETCIFMFKEESLWIKKALTKIDLDGVRTCLNVGSDSLTFRTKIQPWIEGNVFRRLKDLAKVYHLDFKPNEGIDIIWNAENLGELDKEFDLVICTNLLEHVKNPKKVAEGLKRVVRLGGHLIVTVPHNFVYHPAPIDTLFRPTNKELESFFPEFRVILSEIIQAQASACRRFHLATRLNVLRDFLSNPKLFLLNLLYLFRQFEQSCVLLQKPKQVLRSECNIQEFERVKN